jgi:hypothetical protein
LCGYKKNIINMTEKVADENSNMETINNTLGSLYGSMNGLWFFKWYFIALMSIGKS